MFREEFRTGSATGNSVSDLHGKTAQEVTEHDYSRQPD
jgi:hypothetical protein